MTYAVISFLLGAVLGSRWRAIVLVPVSAVLGIAVAWAGLSSDEAYIWVALAAFGCVASLQFGYLAAASLRIVLFGARDVKTTDAEPAVLRRAHKLRTDP